MGLKYAARAWGRGRAGWAGRAEPACGGGSRGLGRGACRGVIGGFAPLPPWGGLSCGLAALYLGTHDVWLLFPLRDLPARSAGRRRGSLVVAEARPSAQLAIPGHNPLASCRRSRLRGGGGLYLLPKECRLSAPLRPPFGGRLPLKGEARGLLQLSGASKATKDSIYLRHAPKRFFWGGTWGPQGPAPAYFTPRR